MENKDVKIVTEDRGLCQLVLRENGWQWRLARTILQGIVGVVIANLDVITGAFVLDPTMKGVIVALVMAVLSPIMALLGKDKADA